MPDVPAKPVRRIYLDNAATSFPKPPEVAAAMLRYMNEVGGNPGRGTYAESLKATAIVSDCRRAIAKLINAESARSIVFTQNCTEALNLAIHGIIHHSEPNHLICTAMEHNSVLRPMHELQHRGQTEVTVVPADHKEGAIDPDAIAKAIRPNTRLIALSHASNVSGIIQPIREVIRKAHARGIPVLVDAAQTAGHIPIDVIRDEIDLLAASGHKGLLGPTGTGFLYIRPGIQQQIRPLKQGGTGSHSEKLLQPEDMPDRFESGTLNVAGIAGLLAAVNWISSRTIESIRSHEVSLMQAFIERAHGRDVLIIGPKNVEDRVGVFCVDPQAWDGQELSAVLELHFGIITRAGLHCAPLAHKTLGTDDGRAIRISFGPFTTIEDINHLMAALRNLSTP